MNYIPTLNLKIKQFKDSFNLNHLPNSELFERFVNRSLLELHQSSSTSKRPSVLDAASTGGKDDMGIDGLFILVNNIVVTSVEEIQAQIEGNKKIDIDFVFIQSKYQDKYDSGELGKFLDGIMDFLSEIHNEPHNEKIDDLIKLKDYLFSDEVMLSWSSSPRVKCYYAICGDLRNDEHFEGKLKNFKDSVSKLNNYSDVSIKCLGARELLNVCNDIENSIKVVLNTLGSIGFDETVGVDNSLMILCRAKEFLHILVNEDGLMRRSFFDDNIRDYQGKTTINEEIMSTLINQPSSFLLRNNGLTIVCSSITPVNRKITLENPQIVNGCQTSNVLFLAHKNGINLEEVTLAIKIIATKEAAVINTIVKGTNSQNILPSSSFETIKPFHKEFEEFVSSVQSDVNNQNNKIFYERRSNQYYHDSSIKISRMFSLDTLTKSFISVFLRSPHDNVQYITNLLEKYRNQIFCNYHSFYPYFLSVLMLLNFERYMQDGLIDNLHDKFKYQILYILGYIMSGNVDLNINSYKVQNTSKEMIKTCFDYDKYLEYCKKAISIFESCKTKWIESYGAKFERAIKDNKNFTKFLIAFIHNDDLDKIEFDEDEEQLFYGVVVHEKEDKTGLHYGFISADPENIFFHQNDNPNVDFANIIHKKVLYSVFYDSRNGKKKAKISKVL